MTRLNNIGLKIEFTEKYKAQIFILLVMTMEKISHVYHDNLFRCFKSDPFVLIPNFRCLKICNLLWKKLQLLLLLYGL